MPYIKYRGGRLPLNISELVEYEDPFAPCYEGLAKLSADARRFAEDKANDDAAIANAVRQYIDNNPYPGLAHLGGVGFIELQFIRDIDEEISVEEYQQIRGQIDKENQEYRTNKQQDLVNKNDPARRADLAHESLGWRTRIWATSYTELEHHVPYILGENSVAYLRVRERSDSGLTLQLIDIYHHADGGIEQAILEGTDWAEILVDLLALLGYGAAHLVQVVSTTTPFCEIGADFLVATFGAELRNSPIRLNPDQFEARTVDPISRLALRHVRDGLSAIVPTIAFAAFWNALECQADDEARTKDRRRIVKCKECGNERTAGWDIKQSMETMYAAARLDPSLFDQHRSRRGTIQHGGKLRTTGYVNEVFQDISQVQTVAVTAVATRLGIRPGATTYLSGSWPVVIYSCCASGSGQVSVRLDQIKVRTSTGVLPQRICGDIGRTVFAGVSSLKVDPLVFPPVHG